MGQFDDRNAKISWGPYSNRVDALLCLGRFTDKALGPGLGVLWSDGQACMLLRKPALDADGFGQSLIAEWIGPLPAARPAAPPTVWERVKHVFERAMELSGEAQIANAEAAMAEGQAIRDWFADKDHEHAVALAFDILGVVGFALLFVPGIGEAEMGVLAAVRAGEYLSAAGRITAPLAFGGASLGAYVDGRYMYARYFSGGEIEGRKAAKEWDDSPQAVTLSLASAILALPDFAVGGIMTVRSLRELPAALGEAREAAAATRAKEAAKLAKADELEGRAAGDVPAWQKRALEKKAGDLTKRADRLARRAEAAEDRARRLSRKLYAVMGVTVPGLSGTPVVGAYYARDNARDESEPFKVAGKYLRGLLDPPYCKTSATGGAGHNLCLRIGTTSASPSQER